MALTIQYYCGTRFTEMCDLHLFCIVEDQAGRASLLIPHRKTKRERLFPNGTPRTLGGMNVRHLNDDPERGRDWLYLFERVPAVGGEGKRRGHGHGRLSIARVGEALHEEPLLAAKRNPEGLFVPGTDFCLCSYGAVSQEGCISPHGR